MTVEKTEFLKAQLRVLVAYFGHARVRSVLDELLQQSPEREEPVNHPRHRPSTPRRNTFDAELGALKTKDPSHYEAFVKFAAQVRSGEILKDVQDIRQFASVVGFKGIDGQSRRELVAPLLRQVLSLSPDRLGLAANSARDISEKIRRRGFSVLTDKLVKDE